MDVEACLEMLKEVYEQIVESRGMCIRNSHSLQKELESISRWLTEDKHIGLMLYGSIGNGKTTAIKAIKLLIDYLSRDFPHLWLGGDGCTGFMNHGCTSMIKTAKAIANIPHDNYEHEMKKLTEVPILFIDDLGTEPTEVKIYGNIINPIEEVIYTRYESQKVTIISTNMPKKTEKVVLLSSGGTLPAKNIIIIGENKDGTVTINYKDKNSGELKAAKIDGKLITVPGIRERYGDRIADRLNEMMMPIEFTETKSYRIP